MFWSVLWQFLCFSHRNFFSHYDIYYYIYIMLIVLMLPLWCLSFLYTSVKWYLPSAWGIPYFDPLRDCVVIDEHRLIKFHLNWCMSSFNRKAVHLYLTLLPELVGKSWKLMAHGRISVTKYFSMSITLFFGALYAFISSWYFLLMASIWNMIFSQDHLSLRKSPKSFPLRNLYLKKKLM